MSLKVITWAWTVRLPPAPKLVLMALADEADDRGFCFPSHRHLANKCSISERSVRRMIGLLAADHHLSIEHRFKKDRARTSNGYRLGLGLDPEPPWTICPGGAGQHWPGGADSGVQGGGQRWPGAPDTGVLVTTTEPLIEPTPPPQAAGEENEAQGRGGGDLCFPKVVTRSQRQALRNHLSGLSNEDAQRVLDELAGRMQITAVNNPIRYCAALVGRLHRGVFASELGLQVADKRLAASRREARLREPLGAAKAATNPQGDRLPENIRASLERMRARFDSHPPIDGSMSTGPSGSSVLGATDDDATDAPARPNNKVPGDR
jgi:Helix-turn-helix domain